MVATSAFAQDKNLSTLQRMGNTDTNMNIPTIPQEGKNADAIRANLKKIKLPDGFKIDLYAVVPDARYMAVAPSTNMLFVGTRKTQVWAVTNRNNGDAATEVKPFAPAIKFSNSPARCSVLPLPAEPKVSCPGRAFASATSSFTDFTGSDGCTPITMPADSPISVSGMKSFSVS